MESAVDIVNLNTVLISIDLQLYTVGSLPFYIRLVPSLLPTISTRIKMKCSFQ